MMAASNFGRRFGRFTVKSRSVCARRTVSHGQVLFAAHDAQFESAKARLSGLKEEPDNLVKLKIYACFKQATIGQCNTPKPGMMDFVGKAKWEAWTELGDMSKDDAQLKYVQIVEELGGKEMPSPETDRPPNSGHFSDLIVDNSNGVYSIAFNRPSKKNALTRDTYEQLQQALSEAAHDDSVVVATMTGTGDYYSSGNDLSNFANIQPEQIPAMASQARDLLNRYVAAYIDFPKPLVAIVNGPAVGVSVTVLGLFDAVYAVDSATFHTPFTVLGQSAEGCSSYVFPKLMGPTKANEMLMFNRKLTAAEACERGLVTEVFPADSFKQEAEKRISAMAKLPRQSLFKSKALIRNVERPTLHATNTRECELLQERWQSQECINAIMKFFQGKS